MRRRDGLALAATGVIPARVRAQVLAEHRADLDARARTRLRARIEAGQLCLPIPYGYRRTDTQLTPAVTTLSTAFGTGFGIRFGTVATVCPAVVLGGPGTAWPGPDSPCDPAGRVVDRGRAGRARPVHWKIDLDCADTIRFILRGARHGAPPARIAAVLNTAPLNTAPDHPPLLDTAGRPRRWTARAIRSLLTDPLLTGHTVWGRTHHGHPVPRHRWTISTARTHPSILDTATVDAMTDLLATTPTAERACTVRPRWRR